MNWHQIEGQWKQLTGQVRTQWAKLTDDDLAQVAGKKDQLIGKLQEHYGILKDDAEKQIDKWLEKLGPTHKKAEPVDPAVGQEKKASS